MEPPYLLPPYVEHPKLMEVNNESLYELFDFLNNTSSIPPDVDDDLPFSVIDNVRRFLDLEFLVSGPLLRYELDTVRSFLMQTSYDVDMFYSY
jgi:hypothetical protein